MGISICALSIVSASEIAKVMPEFTYQWAEDNPSTFKAMLWELGMDVNMPYECQENIQHRNRFEEVVQCDRWVGNERIDADWVQSGLASYEAISKASGNRILTDIFRMKGLVEID